MAGLAPDPGGTDPVRLDWPAPYPLDVRRILSVHRRGYGDPAYQVDPAGAVWRTSLTPDGPATVRVTAANGAPGPDGALAGTLVHGDAWGPGARWLLAQLPAMLGAHDDPAGFAPEHPVLRRLAQRHPGVRLGATGRVLEALVPAVLEQKVLGLEAHRAWRILLRRHGLPAPGPGPSALRVCPPARVWGAVPSWDWHLAGVEAVRGRTIAGAARVAGRLEEITGLDAPAADRRLQALPGIGPWTSAEIRQRACGDADAVSVGDYNLPKLVGWTLARQVVDDAGMLALLAPYAGHRQRAVRLIELGGSAPPRRGPRLSVRDYRGF